MRSTFRVLFYLKRDKQKTNGMVPLYCRITVDGQEARFGMKRELNPKYWDVKAGKATGRSDESAEINTLTDNTKSAIFKVYREMQERDNYVTAEIVKNTFLGIEQKHQTLMELFDSHNEERKQQIGINFTKGTLKKYLATRRYVARFLLHKYNLKDIPVKDVTKQFIIDFETYMYSVHHFSKNYAITLLKTFRHIIMIALDREWIYKNPFKDIKLRFQKVDRGYLTQAEIETMIDAQFEDVRMENARDVFIFCSFTGLAFSDLKLLNESNIQLSIDGKLWIRGKRKKTNTDYTIPMLNIPKMILEKYKGKVKDNRLLPPFGLIRYNRLLKEIGKQCGIEKRMSSHLARHTFATLTLTKGVSIESVSKMLGHTNINTTLIYARITDPKIGNEMSAFAGNVKQLDKKLQLKTSEEINIDDVLKTLKISTGKTPETVWKRLTVKVWNKMTNAERQYFVSEMESKEEKPGTMREFHIVLMDWFLENRNIQNDSENVFADMESKLAVNF